MVIEKKYKMRRILVSTFLVFAICIVPLQTSAETEVETETSTEMETIIPVKDIEVADHETEVEVGSTISLSGTVVPADATDADITYTSSDKAIATVSSTGEVKGLKKGKVTITLSAGDVTKKVSITVKVATAKLEVNNDYLVLKPGETYQLSAQVTPAEAEQAITYSSADEGIASVSRDGFVTANDKGSTTIIASNGDTSIAISVIVNESVAYEEEKETVQKKQPEEETTKVSTSSAHVRVSETRCIDADQLYQLYTTKQVLKIVGDGYTLEIDGEDIVNCNNEFYTDIDLRSDSEGIHFVLNQGNELCGPVTLYLEEPRGKYLYLYHEGKKRYEQIEVTSAEELRLTTAGTYQLRSTKLKEDLAMMRYILIGGVAALLVGTIIYIVVKRKYWFW